jgi:hypothetical protein
MFTGILLNDVVVAARTSRVSASCRKYSKSASSLRERAALNCVHTNEFVALYLFGIRGPPHYGPESVAGIPQKKVK